MSHLYRVGEPYIAGRTGWPEGAEYNFRSGQHELGLLFRPPSAAEIKAVRAGDCEFALAVEPPVIFFLYRFGDAIHWSDAPFSLHLVPSTQRILPDTQSLGGRALLHVVLVDAATGLVQALRAVTLSLEFTRALHAAIREQARIDWVGDAAYDAALADLYRRYPTSADLLQRAAARTRGGE